MTSAYKPIIHCAIYTRKSSEEGLEQSFNSLDAQREACEAFILSQRQEGWRVASTRYDDGGYSGGNTDRPGLKRLLEDVDAKKINVIVVYKVDRLTRSLADFAKIVEALDARRVSFVSVTQQFNTTSSMGRLTLNVLLSFAQFEREVTGERIRDKIAASKRKGMWMGGMVPLGYELDGRKLVPNAPEATLVRKIFALYLRLGCVSRLTTQLARQNIKSKVWTSRTGKRFGGVPFARGALYHLLRNRLYVGEIQHRCHWYPGEHAGIVPRKVWDKVQAQLTANVGKRRQHTAERASSLLTGLLVDVAGNRFTPSFTVKNGRRYHYYVSQLAIRNPGSKKSLGPIRIPAHEVERRVTEKLCSFLQSDAEVFDKLTALGETPETVRPLVASAKKLARRLPSSRPAELRNILALILKRVIVHQDRLDAVISRHGVRRVLNGDDVSNLSPKEAPRDSIDENALIRLTIAARLKRFGGEVHLVVPPNSSTGVARQPKPSLVKAVSRAHSWYQRVLDRKAFDQRSLARHAGLTERYVGKVFGCAFLAPDIIDAILEGNQPYDLTFEKLCEHIPWSWAEQRAQFGFPPLPSR